MRSKNPWKFYFGPHFLLFSVAFERNGAKKNVEFMILLFIPKPFSMLLCSILASNAERKQSSVDVFYKILGLIKVSVKQ